MKKMQCETCGSTDIKKINDDVFECQSCGVQYSSEEAKSLLVEITGTVKIDHSDEVDNALKRAEQFVNDGDTTKAEEYYNKALDLDAENKKANEEIKKIKKEKAKPQNIYILERTISPESAFNSFIKGLKSLKNIAPDIYKEISIISKTECYYPFAVMYGTYSGSYSGTACFEKKVPVPVEKIKEKYINGEFRKVKVQEIEYRTEIDKQPASGTYSAKCREIYSLSSCLTNYCSDTCLSGSGKNFVSILEKYFDDVYNNYIDDIKKLDIDTPNVDIPLADETIDNKLLQRGIKVYKKVVDETCSAVATRCVGGNYSENVTYNWGTDYEEIFYLYVPIQVVEYAYKGDIYLSTTALAKGCNKKNNIYPYYKKVDGIIEEGDKNVKNMRPKGGYGAWAWTIGVFALFIGWYFGKNTYLFRDVLMALAYTNFGLGAFLTIVGLINLVKANKIKNSYIKEISNLSAINKEALNKGYKLFFDNYTGIDSISKCNDIVEKSCDFSCPISEITYEINGTEDDAYDSEDFEEAQDEDEYDEED